MRRVLGTAAAVALLVGATGCGSDAEVLDAGGAPGSPSVSSSPGTPAGSTVVLVEGSAAGGTSDETLAPVTTDAELAWFTAQLTSEALVDDVGDAVATARAGLDGDGAVLAAVVSIGCDAPARVTHVPGSDRVETVPAKAGTTVQCLVPVTTVAVVADPSA